MKMKLRYIIPVFITAIIVYRIVCDLASYRNGMTLVARNESRSGYDYLLRVPPGYHLFSGKRPLLIYLHGSGEVGKQVTDLIQSDPSNWSQGYVRSSDYPFITVMPVSAQYGWDPDRLQVLVKELTSNRDRFTIDETRVYLTGYSMGGFGTFHTAEKYPNLFAAIAPVAGGGDIDKADQLAEIPIWAFHGDADSVVAYSGSKEMIDAIQECGNTNIRLTTFHEAGHGIALDVYRNPQLYQWFLQQRRERNER